MILLADHQDSFTRNLEHLLAGFDEVLVLDRRGINDEACQRADLIVLSPVPGTPINTPKPKPFAVLGWEKNRFSGCASVSSLSSKWKGPA